MSDERPTKVLVATTTASQFMDDPDVWGAWLYGAEELRSVSAEENVQVDFFAALEVDGRGAEPLQPLIQRLAEVDGEHWTYQLDDGRTKVDMNNRLRHITMGQNLATDYACAGWYDWMLFLAADLQPPPDAIVQMLKLGHPLVGGDIPTYGLDGAPVTGLTDADGAPLEADVREHMASAAFVMTHRDLFRFLRWRWDIDAGMSDDPCWHHDAIKFHGIDTWVRHDVVGRHYPEVIGSYEQRGRADLRVH